MHGPILSKLCAGVVAAQMLIAPGVRNFCTGPNCPPVQQASPVYFNAVPQAFDIPTGPAVPSGWVWEPSSNLIESELLESPAEETPSESEGTAQTPEVDGVPAVDAKPAEAPKTKSKTKAKAATSGRWVYHQSSQPIGDTISRLVSANAGCGCGCPNCTCGPAVASWSSSGGSNYVSHVSSGSANYVRSSIVTYAAPATITTSSSQSHTHTRAVLFPRLFRRLRGLR